MIGSSGLPGKCELQGGTTVISAFGPHPTPMLLDDPFDDRQTQAGPKLRGFLCLPVVLEDVFKIGLGYSRALVEDR